MKKIEMAVLSIVFFVLCAAPSVSYAVDTVRYEVIGGDTLVISGTCLLYTSDAADDV